VPDIPRIPRETEASTPAVEVKNVPALVIGSGISGLFTALKLSGAGLKVLLLTKSGLAENNSRYAQGGIAAVVPANVEDSIELHVQDTLRAGAGLCQEDVARSILTEGFPAIEDLLSLGVPFDRTPDNQLALTQEAAHSTRRIIHAGGDATGYSVEMTLIDQVRQDPLIEVMEYCQVTELLAAGGTAYGCRAVTFQDQRQWMILSMFTVLATGGIGQIYRYTTNPTIATGDGIAFADQAGAAIADMEFVQFHPTAFYDGGRVHFLISEALRGEGGVLKNHLGERFAHRYHPDGELAPRDILTRAIYSELDIHQQPCVYLDISHLPVPLIEERFPTILANCLRFGVDIRKDPIPVTPAAHYMMGGVAVDLEGKTTLDGLFAVGEVAQTGLHGANRLASNSLLECVVLARRVARTIQDRFKGEAYLVPPEPLDFSPRPYRFTAPAEIVDSMQALHALMWERVGIVRTEAGLVHTLQQLDVLENEARQAGWAYCLPEGAEYLNQIRVARLITQAAFNRKESLGAHYRQERLHSEGPDLVLTPTKG
jgi:L-aspartate oxidase